MKRLKLIFWKIWYFLRRLIWKTPAPLLAKYVDDLPDILESNYVYLAGDDDYLWIAALMCPCGCGDTIQLNLLPEVRPRWKAEIHSDGTVSLSPSIWSRKGCGSHYFLRNGYVKWYVEE